MFRLDYTQSHLSICLKNQCVTDLCTFTGDGFLYSNLSACQTPPTSCKPMICRQQKSVKVVRLITARVITAIAKNSNPFSVIELNHLFPCLILHFLKALENYQKIFGRLMTRLKFFFDEKMLSIALIKNKLAVKMKGLKISASCLLRGHER